MADRALYGYFREHFLMTPGERAAVHRRFAELADQEGLELVAIYDEEVAAPGRRFDQLSAAVAMGNVDVVAVVSLSDLAPDGDPDQVVRRFAERGAVVVVLPEISDQGHRRSPGDRVTSTRDGSLSRSPGASPFSSRPCAGTPFKTGERVHARGGAVSRSPFRSEAAPALRTG